MVDQSDEFVDLFDKDNQFKRKWKFVRCIIKKVRNQFLLLDVSSYSGFLQTLECIQFIHDAEIAHRNLSESCLEILVPTRK
jgi:hypothetical protein